uniref:Uncharacterized protein n=1 Tax=Psychrobacter sp. (strain PRwf-1) TaxID=349106 RepID=A5WH48_PSYWF
MCTFHELWIYLGQNSGQLQTLIGFIALIIGILTVLYARKQIVIANQQWEDSLKLARFELQLKLLESVYECEKEIENFKKHYRKDILGKLDEAQNRNIIHLDNEVPGYDNLTFREVFDLPFELLKSNESAVTLIIERLTSSTNNELSRNELEDLLKELLRIISLIRKTHISISNKSKLIDQYLQ